MDPKGSKGHETDTFVFPRSFVEAAKPSMSEAQTEEPEVDEVPKAAEEIEETLVDQPYAGTATLTPDEPSTPREKRRVTFSDDAQTSPTTRLRLSRGNVAARVNPGTFTEVEESNNKLQRVACVVHDDDFVQENHDNFPLAIICSIDTREVVVKDFDVPIEMNIDHEEKKQELRASHPTLWYETEYPEDLLVQGIETRNGQRARL